MERYVIHVVKAVEHCICQKCFKALRNKHAITCPLCREEVKLQDTVLVCAADNNCINIRRKRYPKTTYELHHFVLKTSRGLGIIPPDKKGMVVDPLETTLDLDDGSQCNLLEYHIKYKMDDISKDMIYLPHTYEIISRTLCRIKGYDESKWLDRLETLLESGFVVRLIELQENFEKIKDDPESRIYGSYLCANEWESAYRRWYAWFASGRAFELKMMMKPCYTKYEQDVLIWMLQHPKKFHLRISSNWTIYPYADFGKVAL